MGNDARTARSSKAACRREVHRRVTKLTRLMVLSVLLASSFTPVAVSAQTSDQAALKIVQVPSPGTGEVFWIPSDGSYEGFLTPTLDNSEQEYAGQIRLPYAATASGFGACLVNTGAFSEYASITLRLYEDGFLGPAETPFAEASGSYTFSGGQEICAYASGSISVPQTFWVAVAYNSFINGELKLPADTNGFGDELSNRRGGFGLWSDVWDANGAKLFVAFPAAGGGNDPCIEDLSNGVVCLRDGRFEFTGTWTDFANPPITQPLIWTPVENINATAGFQNNPSGIQIVMRVADGCSQTGTYWVWLGGFTGAGWDITVRDTVTGKTRDFNKPRQGSVLPTTTRDMTTFTCN